MTFISSIKELIGIKCNHFWRPAKVSTISIAKYRNRYRLAKVCDNCQRIVMLTREEFYAEFGRIADV